MTLFQTCFVSGMIGLAFQILIKLRGLQKRAKAGNVPFQPLDYFKQDYFTIAMSVLAVFAAYWLLDEWLGFYPAIEKYLNATFALIGYAGSSLLHVFFSQAEKKIMSIIDKKTDIADKKDDCQKQGGTTYDPN